jgi:hypothetical protein
MKMIGSQTTAQSWIFWNADWPGAETATARSTRKAGPPAPWLKVFVLLSITHGAGGVLAGALSSVRKLTTALVHDMRSVSRTSTLYSPFGRDTGPMLSLAGTVTCAAQRAAPPA